MGSGSFTPKHWLFACASLLGAVPALADEAPNPAEVFIRSLSYSGSGCQQGTVARSLSPDAKALTLMFSDFVIEAGSGSIDLRATDQKSCILDLDLHVPAGWSYALASVDYRGFASLQGDGVGHETSSYAFANGPFKTVGQYQIVAEYDDDYQYSQVIPLQALSWSPCSAASPHLVISTTLDTQAVHGNALMTLDSLDAAIQQFFVVKWRRCLPPSPPQAANVILVPGSINFGTIFDGKAAGQQATLTNTGGLTATNIQVNQPAPPFALGYLTCTATLRPGESCALVLGFAPQMAQTFQSGVSFTYNNGYGNVTSPLFGVSGVARDNVVGFSDVLGTLHAYNAGCTTGDVVGGPGNFACVSAAHLYCAARGYTVGLLTELNFSAGYNSPIYVSCIYNATVASVPLATISATVGGTCSLDGLTANSLLCRAAANRHARNAGSPSGFAAEYGNGSVALFSFPDSYVVQTTLGTLSAQVGGICNAQTIHNLNCGSAARRFCNATKAGDTGFLVEADLSRGMDGAVVVACVRRLPL